MYTWFERNCANRSHPTILDIYKNCVYGMEELRRVYDNIVSRILWPRLSFTCNKNDYNHTTSVPFVCKESQDIDTASFISILQIEENSDPTVSIQKLVALTSEKKHTLYNDSFVDHLVFARELNSAIYNNNCYSREKCLGTLFSICGLHLNEDPIGDGSCLFGAISASMAIQNDDTLDRMKHSVTTDKDQTNHHFSYHQSRIFPLKMMCADAVISAIEHTSSHIEQIDIRASFLSDRFFDDGQNRRLVGTTINDGSSQSHPLRSFKNFIRFSIDIVSYVHRQITNDRHDCDNTRIAMSCILENEGDNDLLKRIYKGYLKRYEHEVRNSQTDNETQSWTFLVSPYIDLCQWQKPFVQWLTSDGNINNTRNRQPQLIHFERSDAHVDDEIEISGFLINCAYMDANVMGGEVECHYLSKYLEIPIVCIDWDASPVMTRYVGKMASDSDIKKDDTKDGEEMERLYPRPHTLLDVIYRTHTYIPCDDNKETQMNQEPIYVMRLNGHYVSLTPKLTSIRNRNVHKMFNCVGSDLDKMMKNTCKLARNFLTLSCLDRDYRDINDVRIDILARIDRRSFVSSDNLHHNHLCPIYSGSLVNRDNDVHCAFCQKQAATLKQIYTLHLRCIDQYIHHWTRYK